MIFMCLNYTDNSTEIVECSGSNLETVVTPRINGYPNLAEFGLIGWGLDKVEVLQLNSAIKMAGPNTTRHKKLPSFLTLRASYYTSILIY